MLHLSGVTPSLSTMEPIPDVSPLRTLSPNQRYLGLLEHYRTPLRFSDPLIHWGFDPYFCESAPSPSDQLREETEAAASLVYDDRSSEPVDPVVKWERIHSI